jgi:hypothetical protein
VVMSRPRITYAPCDDTSTAVEVAALSNIYHFILRKKAAPASGPDDAKERSKDVSSATQKYTG